MVVDVLVVLQRRCPWTILLTCEMQDVFQEQVPNIQMRVETVPIEKIEKIVEVQQLQLSYQVVDVQSSRNDRCLCQMSRRLKFMRFQCMDKIFGCAVSRDKCERFSYARRPWSFLWYRTYDQIVCVAVAMRDSSHRPSKLKGSSI